MTNIIEQLEAEQVAALAAKRELPDFTHGDTIKVWVKIREGDKERLQAYEGVVIALNGGGITASFTVRKISYGEGVERVFPYYSPNVASVEVLKRGKVRRAKLYYLRRRAGCRCRRGPQGRINGFSYPPLPEAIQSPAPQGAGLFRHRKEPAPWT